MEDNTIKIEYFKTIIREKLTPLIDNDYYLVDAPFYHNIGDLLIWEGESEFLKTIPHRCLGISTMITYNKNSIRNDDTIILLQGGGNFGDIWRGFQEFRLKIINEYPNNKIIIFPQTIYYNDKKQLIEDAKIMERHKNLTICARDLKSYSLLKEHFKNNILLIPDMAFFISHNFINRYIVEEQNKCLYLKRNDRENKNNSLKINSQYPVTTSDWPTMENRDLTQIGLRVIRIFKCNKLINWYLCNIYKNNLIKKGIAFISGFKEIYTTRLHVAILSILLNKEFNFLDNIYGKNRNFYDTWLSDINKIKFQ